jgi:hypothetical protein
MRLDRQGRLSLPAQSYRSASVMTRNRENDDPVTRLEKFERNPRILVQHVSEQTVLLHPIDGRYFALDDVGSRVWELCDGSLTVAEIAARIHEEFDAPIGVIESDVLELVREFCDEELVTPKR